MRTDEIDEGLLEYKDERKENIKNAKNIIEKYMSLAKRFHREIPFYESAFNMMNQLEKGIIKDAFNLDELNLEVFRRIAKKYI